MKRIDSLADLAIHGAPPAFAQPLHVGRPNLGSREAFLKYANEIFDRRWLSNNGPLVQEFERRLAEFLGVKQCVAMCNGTIALEIATRALELKGEVIVPSYTFIATAHTSSRPLMPCSGRRLLRCSRISIRAPIISIPRRCGG